MNRSVVEAGIKPDQVSIFRRSKGSEVVTKACIVARAWRYTKLFDDANTSVSVQLTIIVVVVE